MAAEDATATLLKSQAVENAIGTYHTHAGWPLQPGVSVRWPPLPGDSVLHGNTRCVVVEVEHGIYPIPPAYVVRRPDGGEHCVELEHLLPVASRGSGTTSAHGKAKALLNTFKRAMRCALAQQKLAEREYCEAVRLRPRNLKIREQLHATRNVYRRLHGLLQGPTPKPLGRFLAHYNLSIRYWDQGKAKQALTEAKQACEELQKAGLPEGCAEHNRARMQRVHAEFCKEERRLMDAVSRSPTAIELNYKLAELYYDKRMLLRAEAQLKWTLECVRTAGSLQLVEYDRLKQMVEYDRLKQQDSQVSNDAAVQQVLMGKKHRHLYNLIEDLQYDLVHLSELQAEWGVDSASTHEPTQEHRLQCFERRFCQNCSNCDAWWAALCSRSDVDVSVSKVPFQPQQRVPPDKSYKIRSSLHPKKN